MSVGSEDMYRDMGRSIIDLVGRTPIVKLRKIVGDRSAEVYVKLEYYNPTGSHKDRIAIYMIREAELRGFIKPGDVVVEASSGNTAISVAWASSILGYRAEIFVEEQASPPKLKLIKSLGAKLIQVPSKPPNDPENYVAVAKKYAEEHGYFYLNQYANEANVKAHYETTAVEIYDQLGDSVDVFVMGIGTCGTIAGVGRFLKEKISKKVRTVGVVPRNSPIVGGSKPDRIEGLAVDVVPDLWTRNREYVDELVEVSYQDALETMKKLIVSEGILGGLSAGANVYAALKVAEEIGRGTVVTLIPDTVLRYTHLI
ncbi:MAG: cysteine synthase family protein [Aigarchaeota archaeon]|nr:cysteine synthase family protein [Aigarchaeota archaeon]MCX8193646.1 cysteine synthase family protein [Nitrososphaeria archaeon]MDW7986978.1 cysteine synthase family protein [Nitrososphaerota archaeon]